ncbi:MAG: AAA family ATPase, partial [Deltaproteobacteria bacterium]|nr:AAA family ATPase [Deltaproteobacteria bacterium]
FGRTIALLARDEFEALEILFPKEASAGPPFAFESFQLLADLHENPTQSFYQHLRDEFKRFVEEPFQQLFREVVASLPPSMTALLETEKRIFARIPKNDFGKGGAWSFYWGALYPQNGQRMRDAQLFLGMNRERLEFGFHIGVYGSEQRKRFLKNCQKAQEGLVALLKESLTNEPWKFGINDEFIGGENVRKPMVRNLGWKEWLKNPDEPGIQASLVLDMREVLQSSRSLLRDQIKKAFEKLFSLVLLAVYEDPLPLIIEYLEGNGKRPLKNPEYTLAECARETGLKEDLLGGWVQAIERKGQAILYGPPGTGKTYMAEKLARHLIGGSDGFWELVQFHPAYTYENFIQGMRLQNRGEASASEAVVPGRFVDFCGRARTRKGECIFIIDELHRAPLAQVFGELMYLLEYRDRSIPLAGGGEFHVPGNVRIIGTMNTADRSLLFADSGLRRRFAFLPLYPNYEALRKYHARNGFSPEGLIQVLESLNGKIGNSHYAVGITYFLREDVKGQMEDIWRMEIEPYLQEYFSYRQDVAGDFLWEQVQDKIFPRSG